MLTVEKSAYLLALIAILICIFCFIYITIRATKQHKELIETIKTVLRDNNGYLFLFNPVQDIEDMKIINSGQYLCEKEMNRISKVICITLTEDEIYG